MAYTDILNEALDDLTATLTAVTGLRVVNDATKIVPNAVFLEAPSFTATTNAGNVLRVEFPIKVIGSGPAGLPVLRSIMEIVSTVIGSTIVVIGGRPSSLEIGGQVYPCYDLDCALAAVA